MLLDLLGFGVPETQVLNMGHLDLHCIFFSHLRRTGYKSVNDAVTKSVGSGALGSDPS